MIFVYTVSLSKLEGVSTFKKYEVLEEFEKAEIKSFTEEKYKEEYLNHLFLKKSILSKHLGVSVKEIRLGKKKFGKPFLIDSSNGSDFNISHSGDFFVCAIIDMGQIGVDVEEVIKIDLQTADEFCCDSELKYLFLGSAKERLNKFYKFWTLKEAYIKAIGMGLHFSPKKICFDLGNLSNIKIDGVINSDWSFFLLKKRNYLISLCSSQKIDEKNIIKIELNSVDF